MKRITTEQFKEKAKKRHGDLYKYDDIVYINSRTKIKIWCNECEDYFEQKPNGHLHGRNGKGAGCYICNNAKIANEKIIKSLTIEEDPIEVDGEIQCKCTHCKNYFIPTKRQILHRIDSLSGKQSGESRLYCSDTCKNLCPIFGKISRYKDQDKPDTSRPVQPELKQLILKRDNNQCQRCGSSENLHCHHITGVEINPIESADIDNCITLCDKCHNKAHSEKGCSMQRQPCVV